MIKSANWSRIMIMGTGIQLVNTPPPFTKVKYPFLQNLDAIQQKQNFI